MIEKQKGYSAGQKARFSGPNGDFERAKFVKRMADYRMANGHPRGMLGKTHTAEAKEAIGSPKRGKHHTREHALKISRALVEDRGLNGPLPRGSWKAGPRKVGSVVRFFRSRWEANYAIYLELMRTDGFISSWEHEPVTIELGDSGFIYRPDFRITCNDGLVEYHEVKGWMDDRSKTKIELFRKFHQDKPLILIQKKWFDIADRWMPNQNDNWELKTDKCTNYYSNGPRNIKT
jgi:hypothetical protein